MIKIDDKSKCCGCWGCYNVCPKQCIEMEIDDEGFHYPVIEAEKCIDCGLCDKVCPVKQPVMNDIIPESFVVQYKDKNVRKQSTSGGFFTAASRYAIRQGGVVFGAAFDEDMVLRHQYAETIEECAKFSGSKYLQSLIGDAYKITKDFLSHGRIVVFSGTPCQIAGLHAYLRGHKYKKLVTIDLVCHGVPSPLLANKYLTYNSLKIGSRVIDYRSRDKYYGYSYSTATITFADSRKQYHKGKEADFMLGLYFKDLISRPSCYACHFKTLGRASDITIFDCWDAPSVSRLFDKSGATNVFIHSNNGHDAFESLKQYFTWSISDIDSIIKRDGVMIKKRVPMNSRRKELFEDLHSGMSVEDISKKYLPMSLTKRIIVMLKPMLFKLGIFSLYLKLKKNDSIIHL